jgi:O-antigen/teichoic acid export membrane protein
MAVATTEPEDLKDPEAAAEEERKASADLSTVARGGMLNLVGAAGGGILTFVLFAVLTRALGAASYGAFVSAMGVFTVLSNTAELGADTGLIRMVSRLRALDRVRDIRKTVYAALIPPLAVGTLFGVAMWMWAPQLAHVFGKGAGSEQIAEFARYMAPFMPAGGVVLVLLAGTRGFGTMLPTVTVDKIGRPLVQVLLVLAVFGLLGGSAPVQVVKDGVLNRTNVLVSATARFTPADVGRSVSGTGIPEDTTIVSVANPTTAVLSAAETAAAASAKVTIGRPGHNHGLFALAWVLPQAIGATIALWWFWGLLLKAERRDRRINGRRRGRSSRVLAVKFWRFTGPRGVAGLFQIVVLWVNTLMVGRLDSTKAAGIFNASTRYVTAGLMVGVAIQQVAGPKLSELMAQRSFDRAQGVYQTTTAWLMVATWPLYFTFAVFAPTLVRVFGHGFSGGAGALQVLALTMLVATAVGTVDVVLLMGGKSSWTLLNTVLGLTSNIALNLILIPRYGGTGAAIAWSSSILFTNLAPLVQVWKFLGMHPFGPGFPKIVLAAGAAYGALGLVLRVGLGTSFAVFAFYQVAAGLLYLAMLWRHRDALQLTVLVDELKRKNRRKRPEPSSN